MSAISLNTIALRATIHCLTGCAIGEVLGMILGLSLGFSTGSTVAMAVALAFLFGYTLTMRPLLQGGIPLGRALRLALAADTASIGIMEIVDNGVMLLIPGAMETTPLDPAFWGFMALALALAGLAAYPVNRWLIARGSGHARVHAHHGHPGSGHHAEDPSPQTGHTHHSRPADCCGG
jgi:hypothetical protein